MLRVNEIFGPTIQGEGKSLEMPCSFLRLAFCNLHCVWCDTKHSWNWSKFDKSKEVHEMTDEQIITELEYIRVKAVVISGGEPLLQQRQLISLCTKLKELNYWIEIETNATIYPNEKLISLVNRINCSPKLWNSLDKRNIRIREKTLSKLVKCKKVNFKFVIDSNKDISELLELHEKFHFPEVYVMPQCRNKEEFRSKREWVNNICNAFDFNFSPRLHITRLGGVRGV